MRKVLIFIFLTVLISCLGISSFTFSQKPTTSIPESYNLSINYQTKSSNLKTKIKSETGDLDADGSAENYILDQNKLTVTENDMIIWQSNDDWQIDDFALADSNNDGVIDLNLSVWKSGNFGTSKPFWIEENDPSIENHFFVLDLRNDQIKPVWQSSSLAVPNCEFLIADVNGDGQNELIVIEGRYDRLNECEGKHLAVWKWNQWGFFNDWRSSEGKFDHLKLEISGNDVWISVDEF